MSDTVIRPQARPASASDKEQRTTPPKSADQKLHATLARLTGGLSPAALMVAWTDWAAHTALSPDRQRAMLSAVGEGMGTVVMSDPGAQSDPRFADPLWQLPPYSFYRDTFLATQNWWQKALAPLPGLDPKHQRALEFYARQALDMVSPSNFALTNPVVLNRAVKTGNASLAQGWQHWLDDAVTTATGKPRDLGPFKVGQTLAITPGDVVYRNRLVELIRYHPTTPDLARPPIFIVPAWIMKYYILDLSPENSMIAYLVAQGFEVFTLSWKNPGKEDADLDLNDYLRLGISEPLAWMKAEHGIPQVHAVGYCLGGTLLAIAAAAAGGTDTDTPFHTLTLLASQTDFTEPGELGTFMSEAQVAYLEDLMADQGYLEARQMAAAFQMLRPADLIWSRVIRHYLLGERTSLNDLMAWNADATRMPARMHTTYLRSLFLENGLANRTYRVDGKRVSLTDIRAPVYCLATETDHVSPWRSVFKLLALTDTDVRFVLTNGGHNGGVLSEPGHKRRHFRDLDKTEGTRFVGPDAWFDAQAPKDGSWWPDWTTWLHAHSSRGAVEGDWTALDPAPGHYVFD
ncbi:PHA/PHB synthase family protein [Tateyamaria sp. SN3-11]|uniref:PHA/PHB synthase family protein n=1 Tax=Tateyamaria sp. SN3-11 TaxID=3092147 RepID=UPI0039ED9715